MVAVFNFENLRDDNGMVIKPNVKYRSGLLWYVFGLNHDKH